MILYTVCLDEKYILNLSNNYFVTCDPEGLTHNSTTSFIHVCLKKIYYQHFLHFFNQLTRQHKFSNVTSICGLNNFNLEVNNFFFYLKYLESNFCKVAIFQKIKFIILIKIIITLKR